MESVLISVKPRHCADMARGDKDLEIRKNQPKLEVPFKCYVYCTLGDESDPNQLLETHGEDGEIRKCNGMVFAEFVCDKIIPIRVFENGIIRDWNQYRLDSACISYEEMAAYIGWGKTGYGWHISDFKVYDQPKGLGDFKARITSIFGSFEKQLKRAPQSWCYVNEV